MGLGAKEFVIFAFFMVLGGAYLFWPPPSEQPALARFASSQDVEEPAAFLKKDSEEKAIPSWNVNTQNNAALSEAFTRFQQEMALILEARRLFAEENREAMEALSARLDAKNQEIKQLKQQLGTWPSVSKVTALKKRSSLKKKPLNSIKKDPDLPQGQPAITFIACHRAWRGSHTKAALMRCAKATHWEK
ncbi:hypothetical protein CJJ19_02500 [Candidatus Williamhamiltonella defendens]|nr:hypothetical protein [Candidatus Hamiltonella defensa]AYB48552.1 hypothetical protein CJJ19_02500 [Candidatus Hamiltonella defensa]